MRRIVLIIFIIPFIIPFFSCKTINPSVMFKTGEYTVSDSTKLEPEVYLIAEADLIELRIFTNDGFRLVDVTEGTSNASISESIQYLVEPDGGVKFPLIGKVQLRGKTVLEAEKILEDKYAIYYNNPFVKIRVSNRHVLVFTGEGGLGKIVYLENENTSVVEAITMAGGIFHRGKAYQIRIIRGDLKNPDVFFVDLSTMEAMKRTNMTVQSKDIIYVEPAADYSSKILAQIAPIVGILTSVLLIIDIVSR